MFLLIYYSISYLLKIKILWGIKKKELSERFYYNKKAKFQRNRYKKNLSSLENPDVSFVETVTHSASSKKMNIIDKEIQVLQNTDDFNFVMSFNLLRNVIMLLKCPNLYGENVYLQLDSSKKYGLIIESIDLEAVSKR